MKTRIRRLFRDQRGVTLIELMVAIVIFTFVGLGFGILYRSSVRAFDSGTRQAFVQRQGTLLVDDLKRRLTPAAALLVDSCGPNTVDGQSMMFQRTDNGSSDDEGNVTDTYWCLYQFRSAADASAQLYLCQISDFDKPAPCLDRPRNLATLTAIRVSNTQFTMGVKATTADIRFEITDGTLASPMRFGLTATARN